MLETYRGEWTPELARKLLGRTVFGPTAEMVASSVEMGLEATIETLFSPTPQPSPPVKSIPDGEGSNQLNDPEVQQGETWIHANPFPDVSPPMLRNRIIRSRSKSMYSWIFLQMFNSGMSIQDKLALFWHNHFVVADVVVPQREYNYYSMLKNGALGNARELTKQVTIDAAMLVYLSGTENTNQAPNENYSRELLELFTLGKGELVGPGDYTTYTEDDVASMARVLTGWSVGRFRNNSAELQAEFKPVLHSEGYKQLSARFGSTIIQENGEDEYKDLIDVIFQKEECARFLARKLYRWFVNSEIDAAIEEEVIQPFAASFLTHDYNIVEPLKLLLSSEHFATAEFCQVKSPIDLVLGAARGMGQRPPESDVESEYDFAYNMYIACAYLDQHLLYHPTVAGWKAYYQAPQLDRLWINNLLLSRRLEVVRTIIRGGILNVEGENYRFPELPNPIYFVERLETPEDPNALVRDLCEMIFNRTIENNQVAFLKNTLIPGLPDYEWTTEYGQMQLNPDDVELRAAIEEKIRVLLVAIASMSENQVYR